MGTRETLQEDIEDTASKLLTSIASAKTLRDRSVAWTEEKIAEAKAQREKIVAKDAAALLEAKASREKIVSENGEALAAAKDEHDVTVARIEEELKAAEAERDGTLNQIEDELQSVCGLASSPWSSKGWDNFAVATGSRPPSMRIGSCRFSDLSRPMQAPAMVNLLCGRNLLIETDSHGKEAAVEAMQSLVFRLFATVPPGKLQAVFIDPVTQGENSAPFLDLAGYKEDLVGQRAVTEASDIEKKVDELNDTVSRIIQKVLKSRFPNVDAYNAGAGELAEPYIVVVVFDFPSGFERCAELLDKIARNGPRCGISLLVHVDLEQELPDKFDLGRLEEVSTVIKQVGGRFVRSDSPFPDADFSLDRPPTDREKEIIDKVGAAAKGSKFEVPFGRIAIAPEARWKWNEGTAKGISVPIGLTGAMEKQSFELGLDTAHHCLLGGTTGSGKSNLLHVLITNLALAYPPEELELYLVDFKKGVEFRRYAEKELPHAKVIALETDREFGLSVLKKLDEELARRGKEFVKANCADIQEFRKKAKLPRILLLVEEFQEFFGEADLLADEAAAIIERLVRQGRSFGIHIILSSQTVAGGASRLRGAPLEQMGLRIALKCSDADSREILGEDNPAAKSLTRPGEGIYNSKGGDVNYNSRFQAARLADQEGEAVLDEITALEKSTGLPIEHPVIFKGFEEAKPEESKFLEAKFLGPTWSNKGPRASIWLGEPLAIRSEPTTAAFYSQSGRNLLIVGKEEDSAIGLLSMALVSLALQYSPDDMKAYVIDMTIPDESNGPSPILQVTDVLPHPVEVVKTQKEAEKVIGEVKRTMDAGRKIPVYLIIAGFQRVRALVQDDGSSLMDDTEAAKSPAQSLATILREGPEKGVHVLAWCDSMTNFERSFRQSLNEFGLRVAFPMVEYDSTKLIDKPDASKLPPYRALFWDENQPSNLEKFRPFSVTETFPDFIKDLQAAMKGRGKT